MTCKCVSNNLEFFTKGPCLHTSFLICFRYLQEVGYTDTILDVRSSRVRSILGLSVADSAPDHSQPNGISGKGRGEEFAVIEEHARSPKRIESPPGRKLSEEEADGIISMSSGKR